MSDGQVAVGGGDDADVDLQRLLDRPPARRLAPRARAAPWPGSCRLMSPISSRNSVPPSAGLELAPPAAGGAGERAALVAEQLGLDQLLGDGRAVRPRRTAPRAGADRAWMARATSSLPLPFSPWISTRPVLERRAMAICSRSRRIDVALADDLGPPSRRARRVRVLALEPAVLQRATHREQRLLQRQRLLDEVVGAQARGLHRGLDGAVAGDHHHGGVRAAAA